jgi:hypothetical protein
MAYKTADVVAAIWGMGLLETKEIARRLAQQFPGAPEYQIARAFEIAADEACEEVARLESEANILHVLELLLDGMSEDITVSEAAEIKAKQGDPLAIAILEKLNSLEYRRYHALWQAACEADPRWTKTDRGHLLWRGENGKGPSGDAMIEWFQTTHPREARRIEAEIEGAQS